MISPPILSDAEKHQKEQCSQHYTKGCTSCTSSQSSAHPIATCSCIKHHRLYGSSPARAFPSDVAPCLRPRCEGPVTKLHVHLAVPSHSALTALMPTFVA